MKRKLGDIVCDFEVPRRLGPLIRSIDTVNCYSHKLNVWAKTLDYQFPNCEDADD